ncbi:hypothetical protein RUM43_000311 [Polyplax serrata]|uniref:Uncharacterized protein n=1 Tax=Polyplax serrata TaxID=468196 RepID=A0AAN8SDU7_POLSC
MCTWLTYVWVESIASHLYVFLWVVSDVTGNIVFFKTVEKWCCSILKSVGLSVNLLAHNQGFYFVIHSWNAILETHLWDPMKQYNE